MAKKKTTALPPSFDDIKKAIVQGLFSIDELLDKFVLKGGNALSLVYDISTRASLDIDLSIPDQFDDPLEVESRIEQALKESVSVISLNLFDFKMMERPREVSTELAGFWGGYKVEFKLIEKGKFQEHQHDLDWLRRYSLSVGGSDIRKFEIDISKFEYCEEKRSSTLDGFNIYVYSPTMIVCEKLRAICQQIDSYRELVGKHKAKRARDFLDIHQVCGVETIDPMSQSFRSTLRKVFEIKNVPLNLLNSIEAERGYHESDFVRVQATVANSLRLNDFDFYFQHTLRLVEKLEAFWDE